MHIREWGFERYLLHCKKWHDICFSISKSLLRELFARENKNLIKLVNNIYLEIIFEPHICICISEIFKLSFKTVYLVVNNNLLNLYVRVVNSQRLFRSRMLWVFPRSSSWLHNYICSMLVKEKLLPGANCIIWKMEDFALNVGSFVLIIQDFFLQSFFKQFPPNQLLFTGILKNISKKFTFWWLKNDNCI